jgi:hypothetical protein
MTAGAGAAGGSPNGAAGSTGATSSSTEYEPGGAGGDNGAKVTVGNHQVGPFGQGGVGGDSINLVGASGSNGAVIITWGNGIPDA